MKYIFALLLLIWMVPAQAEVQYYSDQLCIPVWLEKQSGEVLHLSLELAVQPETVTKGLMFRTELAPLNGMLFVFSPPRDVAMWMKNTLIPLDMLYITADQEIITIHENAIPHDLTPLRSSGDVRFVIELKGGTAARYDIQTGDHIRLPDGLLTFN